MRKGTSWKDRYRTRAEDLLKKFTKKEQTPEMVAETLIAKEARLYARLDHPERINVVSDTFLRSYEWRRVRMSVLLKRGGHCECCGSSAKHGVVLHVDHIKPRRLFPDLALEESNLQVLCEVCNHGKGNWDQTDWRFPDLQDEEAEYWNEAVRKGTI